MKLKVYEELNSKTDFYINNKVSKNPYKDNVYNEVAKQSFEERNLGSSEKQRMIENFPKQFREISKMLNSGSKKSEIIIYLKEAGYSEDQAIPIVNEKFEHYKKQLEIEKKSKTPWMLILVMVIIVIRWIVKITG